MSALTYTHRDLGAADAAEAEPDRKPLLVQVYRWIVESQQRRADREIARYLASRGRLLNDETEREMMRRLSSGAF
jgi:hypothetical protein